MSIPINQWKWHGYTGHFICGPWCRFHLCTEIGDYLISTVGDYHRASSPENSEREEIGCGRYFETMVFKKNGNICDADDCHCGLPEIIPRELDTEGYNEAGQATAGHMRFCRKYARMQK